MGSWDGFRPFKDVSRKSMDVATLALLNLPPPLRFRPELMFVWWGISGHYSDINPFLRVALQDFIESFQQDFLNEESTYTHTLRATASLSFGHRASPTSCRCDMRLSCTAPGHRRARPRGEARLREVPCVCVARP